MTSSSKSSMNTPGINVSWCPLRLPSVAFSRRDIFHISVSFHVFHASAFSYERPEAIQFLCQTRSNRYAAEPAQKKTNFNCKRNTNSREKICTTQHTQVKGSTVEEQYIWRSFFPPRHHHQPHQPQAVQISPKTVKDRAPTKLFMVGTFMLQTMGLCNGVKVSIYSKQC